MAKTFEFKQIREEIPVTIDDQDYVLRTPDGATVVDYKNYSTDRIRFEDGRPVGIKGLNGAESLLVSRCLYPVNKGSNGTPVVAGGPVGMDFINALTDYSITEALAEEAKRMGHIEELKDTVESVQAEIVRLQAKLEQLKEKKAQESEEGN